MAPDQTPGDGEPAAPPSLSAQVGQIRDDLEAQVRDFARLWMLEGELAVRSLVRLLALALAAVVLVVTAWIFAALAVAVWIIRTGQAPEALLIVIALLTVGIAGLAWRMVDRTLHRDWFPATRRRLGLGHPTGRGDPAGLGEPANRSGQPGPGDRSGPAA